MEIVPDTVEPSCVPVVVGAVVAVRVILFENVFAPAIVWVLAVSTMSLDEFITVLSGVFSDVLNVFAPLRVCVEELSISVVADVMDCVDGRVRVHEGATVNPDELNLAISNATVFVTSVFV